MVKTLVSFSAISLFAVSTLASGQASSFQGPQVSSQAAVQDCCATLASSFVSGSSVSVSSPFATLSDYENANIGSASASASGTQDGASNSGGTFTASATANATPPEDPHVGSLHAEAGQGGTYYQFVLDQPSYVEMDATITPSYSGSYSDIYGGFTGNAGLYANSPGGSPVSGINASGTNVSFGLGVTSGSGSNAQATLHTGYVLFPAGTYVVYGSVNASADTGQNTSVNLTVSVYIAPAPQSPPPQSPVIGTVTCLTGSGSITPSSGGLSQPLMIGTPVHMGDVITTTSSSHACVLLDDSTQFNLGSNSKITIDQYVYDPNNQTNDMARYSVLSGLFQYVSGLITKQPNPDVQIHTSVGAIGIRGTELIGDLENGSATVYLDEGEVTATPLNGILGDYLAQNVITFNTSSATTSAFSQSDYDSLKEQINGTSDDTQPPAISCGSAPSGWQSANVVIACTASDSGSGLANPADASFTLNTSVAAGTETANASTGSHQVCDKASNCATAGPIAGIMIDMKPPAITINAPAGNSTYLINASLAANYQCTDAGSGVQSCSGPVANGAKVDTSSAGAHTFLVNATDYVGNASSGSSSYSVSYGVCLLFDNTRSVQSGSTVPIRIALCDGSGGDVSSAAVVVHAVSLTQVSTSASATLESAGSANPDSNFRFDSTLGATGGYIFNLQTTGLTTGTYALAFVAGSDPAMHTLTFQVR